MKKRYTLDGSDALERHLDQTCQHVLHDIRSIVPAAKLEAVLLGGGYGRGEGGVLRTSSGDKPYNDLEFYICIRGNTWWNERKYGAAIHHLGEELSPAAGIEVEFKILSMQKLNQSSVNMFYYDLVSGHRQLLEGGDDLKQCQHHREAKLIPLNEATRLLMNRCSGLLFAREQLERNPFTPENSDFVARNLAKAQLAFGDVVLTSLGQYHWSCQERRNRLQQLPSVEGLASFPEIKKHHLAGVEFKLHPEKKNCPSKSFLKQHAELSGIGLELWLWLEQKRLKHFFTSASDYALSGVDKCPETDRKRNRLINAKTFGPPMFFKKDAERYPRERIFNALPLLLWEPAAFSDPTLRRHLQSELKTDATTFPDFVQAYRSLWQRFN